MCLNRFLDLHTFFNVFIVFKINDMCFNVAIRTLELLDNKAQIGVGGGITIQSKLSEEWQEMNDKINYIILRNYDNSKFLIGSIKWEKFTTQDDILKEAISSTCK